MRTDVAEDSVQLIEASALGDRRAFERLYDRFAGLVFALALRMLGARTDAEDLVQEVFLQAWRRAESYQPARGTPEAWLLTIARSRAVDRLRSSRSTRDGLERLHARPAVPPAEPASHLISREEDGLAVRSALNHLSEEQRRVLELSYFDGLTQSEIAARLGEPLGTIKTRIRLSLERLRRLLGAAGIGKVAP